jgi:hypothetical protein
MRTVICFSVINRSYLGATAAVGLAQNLLLLNIFPQSGYMAARLHKKYFVLPNMEGDVR